jgi:hypothetical protein
VLGGTERARWHLILYDREHIRGRRSLILRSILSYTSGRPYTFRAAVHNDLIVQCTMMLVTTTMQVLCHRRGTGRRPAGLPPNAASGQTFEKSAAPKCKLNEKFVPQKSDFPKV